MGSSDSRKKQSKCALLLTFSYMLIMGKRMNLHTHVVHMGYKSDPKLNVQLVDDFPFPFPGQILIVNPFYDCFD